MRYLQFALLALLASLSFSYNEQDLLRDTLVPYGINVTEVGMADDNAFLKYEQNPTTSPAEVHAANVLALAALADQFPNSNMSMVFTLVGGKPIMVTTARTADINAYSSGAMSPEEFAGKVQGKLLVEQGGPSLCCLPAFGLLGIGCALAYSRASRS